MNNCKSVAHDTMSELKYSVCANMAAIKEPREVHSVLVATKETPVMKMFERKAQICGDGESSQALGARNARCGNVQNDHHWLDCS